MLRALDRWGRSALSLLGRPVELHGIRLGVTGDLLLDPSLERVLGFEVLGRVPHTFLPFAACAVDEGGTIVVDTALPLLVSGESSYYGARGRSLRSLENANDVLLDEDGRVTAVVSGRVSTGKEAGIR